MQDNKTMKTINITAHELQPQEEFIRHVVFMKDDEKVLAVFPFYHNISEKEYQMVVGNFFSNNTNNTPKKNDFCLIHESDFGWGWIHIKMITHLDVAEKNDYDQFSKILIANRVIKENFVLNEY